MEQAFPKSISRMARLKSGNCLSWKISERAKRSAASARWVSRPRDKSRLIRT